MEEGAGQLMEGQEGKEMVSSPVMSAVCAPAPSPAVFPSEINGAQGRKGASPVLVLRSLFSRTVQQSVLQSVQQFP